MMSGQGKPLPDFLKIQGEWIFENEVFLHHENGDGPNFTRGAEREDGTFAVGFGGAELAAAFETEVGAVLMANHDGRLVFLGTIEMAPAHGGDTATGYVFQIDERQATLVIETYRNEGRA